jgi:hypothetical protein
VARLDREGPEGEQPELEQWVAEYERLKRLNEKTFREAGVEAPKTKATGVRSRKRDKGRSSRHLPKMRTQSGSVH